MLVLVTNNYHRYLKGDTKMAKSMTEFEKVMIDRDGMSDREAREERLRAREEIMEMIESGESYEDVADFLAGEYGLEMDYIFDLI